MKRRSNRYPFGIERPEAMQEARFERHNIVQEDYFFFAPVLAARVNRLVRVIQLLSAAALAVIVISIPANAEGEENVLVLTAEEFDANLTFRERSVQLLPQATNPLAPQIIIESPDTESEVTTPVDILISFVAAEDADIDLDTLEIRYGWFDITKRVLNAMSVSTDGIEGKIESMRDGRHKLRMSISDTKDRKSTADITFEIVER